MTTEKELNIAIIDLKIKSMQDTINNLEKLLSDYLNGKITKKDLEISYRNYCSIRDI